MLLITTGMMACVDEVQLPIRQVQPRLVVEGMITDEAPPYAIKLTYSGQFTSRSHLPENLVVNGAIVTLRDDRGRTVRLEQDPLTPAYYWMRDTTFRGQPGRTYTLSVRLPDGTVYVSTPEYMPTVPDIERMYARYVPAPNEGLQPPHFRIQLDTKDPDTVGNYYRWSAYAYLPRWATGDPYGCCTTCWVPDYGLLSDVQSDALINGNRISGRVVYDIPVRAIGMQYIDVRQYSLTRTAYQYWTLFGQQVSRTGSLFDPQTASIEGNVHRVEDAGTLALGYFGASAVSHQRLVVSSADTIDVPKFVFRYDKLFRLPGSCLQIYPQAQLTPPPTW
ncbi:DUF4249 domain-containing protein [Spirosoma taeanense]|nr:DUF4249 domain-containing protein [Spirosoma taeanense]